MSRAWMPFYVGDYLRNTMHLTPAQHGMYLLLICHYWEHGSVPETSAARARVARCHPVTWNKYEPIIAEFFLQPGWRHKRINEELAKFENISSFRKVAGSRGGTKTSINRHLRAANGAAIATRSKAAIAAANAPPITKKDKKEAGDEENEPSKEGKPSIPISPALLASVQRWRR